MLFRSNDTATTEIYTMVDTLSLHDALPICVRCGGKAVAAVRDPAPARMEHTEVAMARWLGAASGHAVAGGEEE